MTPTSTPTNPGLQVKSQLILKGIKLKDLIAHTTRSQPTVSLALKQGRIPVYLAETLEMLGIGTALDWVTRSAQYKLYCYQLRQTSAQA